MGIVRTSSRREEKLLLNKQETSVLSQQVPLTSKEGDVLGVMSVSLDISKQEEAKKKLMAAKKASDFTKKVKAAFLHNMEHDIRTPLNGIVGLLTLLFNQETDPSKRSYLSDLISSSTQLLNYSNEIVDFSKIESNTLPLLAKPFELKPLVESVINMEMPAATLKGIALSLNYPDHLPDRVIGDSYRLRRILLNLLSNAIKFTDAGSVKLIVKFAQRIDRRHILVQFIIQDSGKGISEDLQNRIYESFFYNPANQGLYKNRGLGLGLRVVKQFVDEMEGDIEMKSQQNKGTIVLCTLPFRIPLIAML